MLRSLFASVGKYRMRFWLSLGTWTASAFILSATVYLAVVDREQALEQAEDQAGAMASYLSQHARDTFEIAELALTSVGRLIDSQALTQRQIDRVRVDMKELLRKVPRLSRLAFYEQSGWLITSSDETSNEVGKNISRDPVFVGRRKAGDTGLHVGQPYRAGGSGPWQLDLSQAVVDADGAFGGVLIATMEVRYFSDFYSTFEGTNEARVALLGPDGSLLARNPYDETIIGMNLSGSDVFEASQKAAFSGHLRATSPIDGVRRICAFHQVLDQPLTVIYSVTEDAALRAWRQGLPVRMALAGTLVGALLLGGNRFARYSERKVASEATLLEMSRTDALTGLLNRRAFDHKTAAEWLQCLASAKPLSLLMIDVDNFKGFNDAYGHPEGDACLKSVAAAIRQSLHRSADHAMRYGGEEFAAVLPNTLPDEAAAVAERVRQAVADLRIPNVASPSGGVTISVGYVTEDRVARVRASRDQLVSDADRALYAAKIEGRNRIVCGDAVASDPRAHGRPRLVYSS